MTISFKIVWNHSAFKQKNIFYVKNYDEQNLFL